MELLGLPVEVICEGVLPHLSICDLQALDTAYTNKYLRPQLQQVWESYQYESVDVVLMEYEVDWLCRIHVNIISLSVELPNLDSVANIPTMKKLNAPSKSAHADIVLKLAANCPDLEELNVCEVCGPNTDDAVSALAQNCRQLHTIRISMTSVKLTDTGFIALSQHCRHLHTLQISESSVSDAGIQALCDNCPHLKHIELLRCNNLTDATLTAIANSYPYLQSINCLLNNFTDDGLLYFADKCHDLQAVSFESKYITSRGLAALWAANPNLMDIDVSENMFMSDDDIIQLVRCCPLLQNINISHNGAITDAAVIATAEHCQQLRLLNIRYCCQVTDASLITLGQHYYQLKSIDIMNVENISDVGIAALAAGCPLLQEFYAHHTNIADAGVVALARGCRDLRKIELAYCQSIGIAAISALTENCPLISVLYLFGCLEVNDNCMYVIALHCRNLIELTVSYSSVSDVDALISVIKSCRMLREIECYNCYTEEKDKAAIREWSRRVHVKK